MHYHTYYKDSNTIIKDKDKRVGNEITTTLLIFLTPVSFSRLLLFSGVDSRFKTDKNQR